MSYLSSRGPTLTQLPAAPGRQHNARHREQAERTEAPPRASVERPIARRQNRPPASHSEPYLGVRTPPP
ncbi:MAG: hypothetical protein AAGF97_15535, partial [Planctomycetota bacterium]